MKKFIPLCAVLLLLVMALPAFADSSTIQVEKNTLDMDFPTRMTFALAATSSSDITKAQLVVRFSDVTQRLLAEFSPNKKVDTTVVWDLSEDFGKKGGYMPPGISGTYSWVIEDAAGNKTETTPRPFKLEDTRFPFQVAENDELAIHWYNASDGYGERLFDNADQFVKNLRQELGAPFEEKVEVWLYSELEDFRSAARDPRDWTGGTSYFNYHVILLSESPLDPPQALAGVRHELTHQTLHDFFSGGIGSNSLPLWMNEGFAVYNGEANRGQLPGYFQEVLDNAVGTDQLPSLKSLSAAFATDRDEALLSYAMGYSVVKMMVEKYGMDKFRQALEAFKSGEPTDQALMQVYGLNTLGLENQWRKSLGLEERDPSQVGFFTPEAKPTFSFSSAETPAPKGQATPTRQSVSVANTPAAAQATAVPQSSNATNAGSISVCGVGGGFLLAMVGAYGWRRRRHSTRL